MYKDFTVKEMRKITNKKVPIIYYYNNKAALEIRQVLVLQF